MQDDFDSRGSDSGFDLNQPSISYGILPGKGGWHWLQTIVALGIVGLLSMLCAFLTRNVEERPVWMMGLIFMVPTAALMGATILVEKATSAMTPSSSRKPQIILAVTATVLTFVVACLCDLIYLYGFKSPLPPADLKLTPYEASDRLLIIADRTASMQQDDAAAQSSDAVRMLLDHSSQDWNVGIISGNDVVEPASLSESQRRLLLNTIDQTPDLGRMYYEESLSKALDLVEKQGIGQPTRILLLTDGRHTWSRNNEEGLINRCLRDNATVSILQLGTQTDPVLAKLIDATGGLSLTKANALQILENMQTTQYLSEVTPAPVEEKLKLDLLRNREPAAILISCIMLLLEGLSLGICISLMLSVRGQFRFQYIISPLMGVLAFALLKFIWNNDDIATTWWIKEGVAFTLLGIVLMNRNRRRGSAGPSAVHSVTDFDDGTDF